MLIPSNRWIELMLVPLMVWDCVRSFGRWFEFMLFFWLMIWLFHACIFLLLLLLYFLSLRLGFLFTLPPFQTLPKLFSFCRLFSFFYLRLYLLREFLEIRFSRSFCISKYLFSFSITFFHPLFLLFLRVNHSLENLYCLTYSSLIYLLCSP